MSASSPPISTDSDSDSAPAVFPNLRMDTCSDTAVAPTLTELRLEKIQADLVRDAKYPIRANAVLTPEQLAATRAQLGDAAFIAPVAPKRSQVDRRALTPEEVKLARAMADTP